MKKVTYLLFVPFLLGCGASSQIKLDKYIPGAQPPSPSNGDGSRNNCLVSDVFSIVKGEKYNFIIDLSNYQFKYDHALLKENELMFSKNKITSTTFVADMKFFSADAYDVSVTIDNKKLEEIIPAPEPSALNAKLNPGTFMIDTDYGDIDIPDDDKQAILFKFFSDTDYKKAIINIELKFNIAFETSYVSYSNGELFS